MGEYSKPPLSFEAQADRLIERGLAADRDQLIKRLSSTSYFRLCGYIYPFKTNGGEALEAGLSLDKVWQLYSFDQRLRTVLLDAIEAIEVFIRTQLAYHFSHDYGAFAYQDPVNLPNLPPGKCLAWHQKLDSQVQRSLRSHEEFVVHFFNKYGDEHSRLPIWMLVELMDFGATLTFYRGVSDAHKKRIAQIIKVPDRVLSSWLLALNTVRNRCAHHSRLWNWQMGNPVLLPNERKYPDWHKPRLDNRQIGIVLTLCRHMLNHISPANTWSERVFELFELFPDQPLAELGLPSGWKNHPLWKL